MRTWEEYRQIWIEETERLRNSENQLDKMKYAFLEQGLEMSCIPPVGIELSVAEYIQFSKAAYDMKEIHGWCCSGKDMHERIRLASQVMASGRIKNIGVTTPRKGFYYIRLVDKEKAELLCYYNYKNRDEFLEESVEISITPFLNYVSIGPKAQSIGVGDIIEVKTDPILVEYSKNGNFLNAYKIEWDLIKKHPKLSPSECEKIRSEIEKLKEDGYWQECVLSNAKYDRAEVRAGIKDELDLSYLSDSVIEMTQKDLMRIKEQIAYYEGLLENCEK